MQVSEDSRKSSQTKELRASALVVSVAKTPSSAVAALRRPWLTGLVRGNDLLEPSLCADVRQDQTIWIRMRERSPSRTKANSRRTLLKLRDDTDDEGRRLAESLPLYRALAALLLV